MELFEQIQLRGKPFPNPLPLPADELVAFLSRHGFAFTRDGAVLLSREKYNPSRFERLRALLEANQLSVAISRTIWEKFDHRDFTAAPLWLLIGIPEIWIAEVDFAEICKNCGHKSFRIDPNLRVKTVRTRKPLVSVNGQFSIVRDDFARRFEDELTGVVLQPFDEQETYHYLLSEHSLRSPIVKPDQAIGLNGNCRLCDSPIFEVFFGPLRYSSAEWHGEDVVHCDFLSCNAYTPKAFELLTELEPGVKKNGLILFGD